MQKYNPNAIEKKWQNFWDQDSTFKTEVDSSKEKFYALVEFPYPSGEGLHVGHPRPYTALDVVSRKRRMQNYNVLYPMGWDAFGLPTENYAIKHKIHPAIVTKNNISRFKAQLKSIGFSFDWDREVNTTDPEYYKWTQWIFLKLFENGLAYKKEMPINWCTSCKVGLANEEVVGGVCERCGSEVIHKVKNQWMLKITEYADRLIDDLEGVNFPDRVKAQQINWIGRSYGMDIDFKVAGTDENLRVFTTRPDTIYGSTYMVIAVEHPIIDKYVAKIENIDEVKAYREETLKKSDFERAELVTDKTGVEIKGLRAINPATGEEIPIWVSDYVLMSYGTGAIMAVPGHDTRDYEFAKTFNQPIIEVVSGGNIEEEAYTDCNHGTMVNSGILDGLDVKAAQEKIAEYLESKGLGEKKVNYKLRDWVFSRQRYWGEPIPIVHCEDCGFVAVPYEELPVLLPEIENYEPSDTGESPLSTISEFVNTTCPKCGKHAHRETDTMPQWAGSSWYFLRYTDPKNDEEFASAESLKYYTPVDWYNGGMEHTTLHLLYSRFWHKFLYDLGLVPTSEPYMKRTSHGMILGDNNEKMSKSRGNVINPDDIVEEYGADTFRTYEMFIGDFEKSVPWSENGVKGCRKFLDRVWNLQEILTDSDEYTAELETIINQTIKKVSEDYETLKYNTAIAQLMTLLNEYRAFGEISKADYSVLLLLLYPVAPHITEELWEIIGREGYIHEAAWPVYDEDKLQDDMIELPVQIMGKMRGTIMIPAEADQDMILEILKSSDIYAKHVEGKNIVKVIFVPGRIFNLIVK
ncbi:leucine--tRNA ligase [Microaceticoccus formicicus]|uniref:leucine--tRNA ligase n=1 Tax=Microaceticoccus formicicus TaxID=3118105 RepID=UPI003CD02ED0|nr:leucine--tRNA ligase [Peptoniphilaceae bacterium AMB_02]